MAVEFVLTEGVAMSLYVLRPRPPRLAALAALLVIGGAVLAGVGWAVATSKAWWIAAGIVGGLGLLLVIVAAVTMRQQRVWVQLDARGYTIVGPQGEFTGEWRDVTRAVRSRHRDKLALMHGEQRKTVIAHPAHQADAEFDRLHEAVQRYLG